MPNVGIRLFGPQQAAALLLLGIELGLVFFQQLNEVGRFRRAVRAGKNRHGAGLRGSWTKGPTLSRNLALDGLGQRLQPHRAAPAYRLRQNMNLSSW